MRAPRRGFLLARRREIRSRHEPRVDSLIKAGQSTRPANHGLNYERLLYRNQFILGPRHFEELPSWKRVSVNDGLCLTVHPDLSCYQASKNGKSLPLLGFILDPADAGATDQSIVEGLVCKLSQCEDFFPQTYRYGGRWILIAADGNTTALFHDAAGIRQAYYTNAGYGGDTWCASQPGLLAKLLGLQMSQEALGLIDSHAFRQNREYWWPGDGSPYAEISHLLPNHWLNLKTRQVRRYWPDGDLPERPLEEVIEPISTTLRGMLASAAKRFELVLAITAGWDSRLLLAASKNITPPIPCMTVRQIGMRDNHPDISVPARLLPRLGREHHIVTASLLTDPDFTRTFKANVLLAHNHYAPDAQAILQYYGLRKTVLSAGVSEVARYPLSGILRSAGRRTAAELSETVFGTGKNPFAIREIEKWFAGVGNIFNLNLDTIFFWEQRVANWLAGNQLEFDTAWQEIVMPYNCRNLLIDMLSVRQRDRLGPRNILFRRLIMNLWPEVMQEPINPHSAKFKVFTRTLRFRVKNLLLRIPLIRKRVQKG